MQPRGRLAPLPGLPLDLTLPLCCPWPPRAALQCIPLSEVVDVRKKKNVGFPNSIEFTLESGKREFFTSFLAREEAYK